MKNWIAVLTLSVLAGCASTTENEVQNSKPVQETTLDYQAYTKVYGDSLKIEYEKFGNTVIQHLIDLKGTEDDGFDNSYTITSIWSSREVTSIDCQSELQIVWDSLDFRFCVNQVINRYDSLITEAGPWIGEPSDSLNFYNQKIMELREMKSELEKIKNKKVGHLDSLPFYTPFELLRTLEFNVTDLRTNDQLNRVLVEEYVTDFSGGKNFYLVNSANDTIGRVPKNEYIK